MARKEKHPADAPPLDLPDTAEVPTAQPKGEKPLTPPELPAAVGEVPEPPEVAAGDVVSYVSRDGDCPILPATVVQVHKRGVLMLEIEPKPGDRVRLNRVEFERGGTPGTWHHGG